MVKSDVLKDGHMVDDYSLLEVMGGTAVTIATQEILERLKFPNPTRAEYLTPAFAVAFFTGIGAVLLAHRIRGKHDNHAGVERGR